MKKAYMNPEIEIVKIQAAQMLAASGESLNINEGSASEFGARGFDFDDEEEY